MEENNRNEMIESQNQNQQVVKQDDNKLTTGEKVMVGGAVVGIGIVGYLLGTYIVAPIVANARYAMAERKAEKAYRQGGRKRSGKKVDYDEDGDYREVDDQEEDDEEKK